MNHLKNEIKFIKKIGEGIYKFIDNYINDTLYLIDFEDVKKEYFKVLEIYKNSPDSLDLEEFSKNYAFAFFFNNKLNDYKFGNKIITKKVHTYLLEMKKKGEI